MPNNGLRLAGRLTIGFSGQAFARIILALNTVALVPILIRAWGVSGYGEWIALTALSSYMAYSNFGLVTTSVNEMIMAAGANDIDRATRTFQMSLNLAIYVVLPLILLILAVASISNISAVLSLSTISGSGAMLIMAFAGVQLWVQTLRSLMVAALYATGSYGLGYYISGGTKLLELICVAVSVSIFGATQVTVAATISAVAILDLSIVVICSLRAAPWARVDLRVFDRDWMTRQSKPAIGFAVWSLSTMGVLIQAPRIVLSVLLGGQAVACYAIYATAMRLTDQVLLMLLAPLEVEVAHAVGTNDLRQVYKLASLGTQFSWILFLGVSLFFLIAGPVIFHFWTRGQISFSYGLMSLFLLMSACNQLGRVSGHAIISSNRLYGPSWFMLACSIASVGVGAAMVPWFKIPGMVTGGILGELCNSIIAIVVFTRWLKKPISVFFREQLDVGASFTEIRSLGGRVSARVRRSL